MTKEELQDNTVADLREIARDMELTGYSSLRKDQLTDLILANQTPSVEESEEAAEVAAEVAEKGPVWKKKKTKKAVGRKAVGRKAVGRGGKRVALCVALVKDAMEAGLDRIDVPYFNDKIERQVLASLTPAERRIVVFGGTGRGVIG